MRAKAKDGTAASAWPAGQPQRQPKPKAAVGTPPLPSRTRMVETSHGTIALRETAGTGTPVLLLHGNSSDTGVFDAQFQSAIGQGYRLMAVDLPGHGASSNASDPSRTYTLPGYADAAIEVLEANDIERVVLVGWSLGGHIALEMLSSFPGVIGAMIVSAPPLGLGVAALQQAFRPHAFGALAGMVDLSEEQIQEFARLSAGARQASAEAAIRRTDGRARSLMVQSLLASAYADERGLVAALDLPIAVVAGAEDPLVDVDYLRGLSYANLWGGTCHVIPQAGHAPFLDSPQLFNHLLTRFLGDMTARARHLAEHPSLVYSG